MKFYYFDNEKSKLIQVKTNEKSIATFKYGIVKSDGLLRTLVATGKYTKQRLTAQLRDFKAKDDDFSYKLVRLYNVDDLANMLNKIDLEKFLTE